jgi:hypothetical protein
MTTAQKLLLFWRKPAVGPLPLLVFEVSYMIVNSESAGGTALKLTWELPEAPKIVKLWARRVWTLELSLVSLPHPSIE